VRICTADCYYYGRFTRHAPGAVHSWGEQRSCQGSEKQRSDIVWGWEIFFYFLVLEGQTILSDVLMFLATIGQTGLIHHYYN